MWLRRVLSRATLDESDISQPIPAGLLNSTEDFSAIPDMISFFYLSCKLFRLLKAIWPVVNARSKQPDATTWIDKPDLGADSTHRPKKNTYFRSHFQSDFASRYCQLLLHDPLFGSRAFSHQIVGSMLTRAVITRILFYQKGGNHLNSAGNLLTSQFVADTAKNRYFFQLIGVRGANSFFWQLLLSAKSIGGLNEFWCIWLAVCL